MVLAIEPGEMPNTIGKLVDFIVKEETGRSLMSCGQAKSS
jgi:hypothetical protein